MPKTAASQVPATVPFRSYAAVVMIGTLARVAGVGFETLRYYQRRRLLAVPHSAGGVRRYPAETMDRIRFIKRSQDLGFSLKEIREMMCLEQGGSRAARVVSPFALSVGLLDSWTPRLIAPVGLQYTQFIGPHEDEGSRTDQSRLITCIAFNGTPTLPTATLQKQR